MRITAANLMGVYKSGPIARDTPVIMSSCIFPPRGRGGPRPRRGYQGPRHYRGRGYQGGGGGFMGGGFRGSRGG